MDSKDRFQRIRKVLFYVLVLNWLVAFAKIIYGLLTKCVSMSADGAHSLSDGASNIIGLVGIWAAAKPVDKDHPYGHKKYETFSVIGIVILLILLLYNIARSAISRFFNPIVPEVTGFSFVIMAVTLVVNALVMRYEIRRSKELNSDILYSDAMHTKSDILVSLSVIGTLISVKMGWAVIDTIVAMLIAGLIGHTAYELLRQSSKILCDEAVPVADDIKRLVMCIGGVKECHMIRTRGRQDDVHVDLHVVVNPDMHVGAAHNITELIEKNIKERIVGVTDVVVHVEPK